MKSKIYVFLLAILFITGCTELDTTQTYVTPVTAKQIAPIVEEVKIETDLEKILEEIVEEQVIETPVVQKSVPVIKKTVEKEISDVPLLNNNTYTNVDGNTVHSPAFAPSKPAGASARCRDGSYSFSQNRRGTCSGHGGVATWY